MSELSEYERAVIVPAVTAFYREYLPEIRQSWERIEYIQDIILRQPRDHDYAALKAQFGSSVQFITEAEWKRKAAAAAAAAESVCKPRHELEPPS